jgi:hypothetical protein
MEGSSGNGEAQSRLARARPLSEIAQCRCMIIGHEIVAQDKAGPGRPALAKWAKNLYNSCSSRP